LIHCNFPGDIVPPENVRQLRLGDLPQNGLFLGLGWHGLERNDDGAFRWLGREAEIIVTRPDGSPKRLVLDVQAGPGRLCRPFRLRLVGENGKVIGSARVPRHRGLIKFEVRPEVDGARFLLKASWGILLPTDLRILNACVRRISWAGTNSDESDRVAFV
jgi:hypothetical protein